MEILDKDSNAFDTRESPEFPEIHCFYHE